jgi:DNA-directed RNA polymerase specialized sigma24 family protein
MGRPEPSDQEKRSAYRAAVQLADSITHSSDRARDVVQEAFLRTLSTRPWRADDVTFEDHMLGIVRSLLNIEHRSAARRNASLAADGFHREVVGYRTESAEADHLEHEHWARRDADAASLYEKLAAAIAHHPVAPEVLRCVLDGNHKAADVAERLGVPVEKVYRANEVIKDNLRRIREDDHV